MDLLTDTNLLIDKISKKNEKEERKSSKTKLNKIMKHLMRVNEILKSLETEEGKRKEINAAKALWKEQLAELKKKSIQN